MYRRRICDKCNLTCFANTKEKLKSMVKRYKCDCKKNKDKSLPEYIGTRILCSKNNIKPECDDYESDS